MEGGQGGTCVRCGADGVEINEEGKCAGCSVASDDHEHTDEESVTNEDEHESGPPAGA